MFVDDKTLNPFPVQKEEVKKPQTSAERLEHMADFLETKVDDEHFRMGFWAIGDNYASIRPHQAHDCMTHGCIAGWACQQFPDEILTEKSPFSPGWAASAQSILGLTDREADFLFHGDWIDYETKHLGVRLNAVRILRELAQDRREKEAATAK